MILKFIRLEQKFYIIFSRPLAKVLATGYCTFIHCLELHYILKIFQKFLFEPDHKEEAEWRADLSTGFLFAINQMIHESYGKE